MAGGTAMRVAGKIAGVVYGSFRGGFPAFPGNITSALFRANTTRPTTGVISETKYKPLIEFEDGEVAEEVASSCDVGQPLPRLVFGGPPTLVEAKDATFQPSTAIDQAYLSNESCEGSCESEMGHDKLALSDSGHLESKTCVTKASAPNQAIQASRLLKESVAAQTVVASIASDPYVRTAVMKNEALLEFFQSQNTGMNSSLVESIADTEIPGYQNKQWGGGAAMRVAGGAAMRVAGGAAMRVAGKITGVVYGSFRGGFPAFPGNITSALFKANTTRPSTGVISETQYDAASSMVNKPLIEFEDGEVAEEVASSCDVGQPLPRLVFGGAPTLEEAKDATCQLSTALDQAYLSNESSEGSCESDMGHDKVALSDSGHLESKTCVTKASAPNQAIRAYRLVKESAAAQTAVVSLIYNDPNVWNAVMKNEAVLEYWEYFQSQNTGMNGSLEESIADTEIPGYQSANYSNDERERKNGFVSFFEDIKSRVEDMMSSLSSFFQNRLSSFFQNFLPMEVLKLRRLWVLQLWD